MKKLYLLPLLFLLAYSPILGALNIDSPQIARQKGNTYIEKKADTSTKKEAVTKKEAATKKEEKVETNMVPPTSSPNLLQKAETAKEPVVKSANTKSFGPTNNNAGFHSSSADGDNWFTKNEVFNHLDAAFTAGTTGIGFELATPITKWVRLRAGYEFMPQFTINSHFNVANYGGLSNNGKPNTSTNFEKASDMLRQLTGYSVDRKITMNNKVTFQNWKVLFDLFPIPGNRHWRVTAGLLGGSRVLGNTINARGEYTSLVAIGIFNHMYESTTAPDFMDHIYDEPIFGTIYLDPEVALELQKKMLNYGRFGIHVGDFKDGTPYMMEPDEQGSVRAKALINRVRPYLGIGYEGYMDAAKRWSAGFDLGVIFWGGVPKVYTHDGVCLNDLDNLRGDVKDYLDLMKGFPVYPTLNFRLSYTIF